MAIVRCPCQRCRPPLGQQLGLGAVLPGTGPNPRRHRRPAFVGQADTTEEHLVRYLVEGVHEAVALLEGDGQCFRQRRVLATNGRDCLLILGGDQPDSRPIVAHDMGDIAGNESVPVAKLGQPIAN